VPSDFHDAAWVAVPEGARPEAFAPRRAFLLHAVRPGDRVLDLGCGDGAFAAELAGAGAQPVGVDVSEEAVRRARAAQPNIDFHLVEAGAPLPFEDASFDVVWAGEVIEHVLDVAGLLSEVRRVLRPEGRLLVTTPNHPPLRALALALSPRRFARHFDPRSQHVRFLTGGTLRELLEDLGFADVKISTTGGPPFARSTLLARAVRPRLGRTG
jgi:SAM-dependent methyltransferase